jgi:hypothetical protein
MELTPLAWTALVGGGLVAFAVCVFLFRLGCILADVTEPSLVKSVLIVLLLLGVTLPAGYFLWTFLSSLEARWTAQGGLLVFPGLSVYLVAVWLLAGLVYSGLLAATFKKGLMIAGVEVLLTALLVALLTAAAMVGLAGWQISQRPSQAAAPAVHQPWA